MNTVSFSDLNKSGAISDWFAGQMSSFTPALVAVTLAGALLAGLIISWVYKKTYRGVLFSPSFSLTLIMLTVVTAPVVMAIGSDVALSMGMVGALSIVRFRTAVKEPLDTAYMFWALTMGILLGAELYIVAIAVALGIAVILFVLTFVKFKGPDNYLLVVHYDEAAEHDIDTLLKQMIKQRRLRSKTVTRTGAEMTVEVRLDNKHDLVAHVLNIEGVYDATLVSCQTDAGM